MADNTAEQRYDEAVRETMTPLTRPTIAELEAILASPNAQVEIMPNGEVRAAAGPDRLRTVVIAAMEAHAAAAVAKERERCARIVRSFVPEGVDFWSESDAGDQIASAIEHGDDPRTEGK